MRKSRTFMTLSLRRGGSATMTGEGVDLSEVSRVVTAAAEELCEATGLGPCQMLVLGCSTSEILGKKIGTAGDLRVARAVIVPLIEVVRDRGLDLAVQCCEHLNRALVVEKETASRLDLPVVTVLPRPAAGGAVAAAAFEYFKNPVVVEEIQAHAGMDIGNTLIGMHLRPVAIPVRLAFDKVGGAPLVLAGTRPKLIGGSRACYPAGLDRD